MQLVRRHNPWNGAKSAEHWLMNMIGGSAAAAGQLVEQLGGDLMGFLFILELDFLKGRDKLTAPVITLLSDDTK